MAETRRRGFHALEDRIHELEEADRREVPREEAIVRSRDLAAAPEGEEVAAVEEIKPPPAHEE